MSLAGDTIRDARARSGISQRELARRAGTSQAAISRIERGLEDPTVERLQQILTGLGLRPVIELVPVAEHDAEPARLSAAADADVRSRLEGGLNWMDAVRELAGAAGRAGG